VTHRLDKSCADADAIIYDPVSKHIFSFNGKSHNSTVIEPKDGTVVGTIEIGGGPDNAAADGKGTIYNNNEEQNNIAVIDSRGISIKARWPVAPAGGPTAPCASTVGPDDSRSALRGRL
jgi:DNA-binding beta-propeller fold protein YncE